MKKNKSQTASTDEGRRLFLKGVAVASAAGVAAASSVATAETAAPMLPANEAEQQGYHETDHIRSYYASCR